MTHRIAIPFLIILGALIVLLNFMMFTVDQRTQAIVLRFGALTHVHTDPGLKFRIPFIDEVILYEKRVLDYDVPPIAMITLDQKRLVVDTYTRYIIKDPVLFFQTIKPATEEGLRSRLEIIISSTVRNVLGKIELRKLLSEERGRIIQTIEEEVKAKTKNLGVEIIDVRIIRTELPPENRNAVFARMNAELNRIASENRANGMREAQVIKSKAEAERTVILAEAEKKAEWIRGDAEVKAITTMAPISKDIPFYNFYRSMKMYDQALTSDTSLILSSDNDLFRFMVHPDKQMKD
jgi:membrane protease subunit HflC